MSLFLTACIQNISPEGVTIRVPASSISNSLESQFPIKQSFNYGDVELSNPKALLQKGSNRVKVGTALGFNSAIIPKQNGSLYISGIPFFDPKSGNIYLREPMIDNFQFNGFTLPSITQSPLKNSIIPIINEIFKTTPIYKVNRSSLQGSFVKNVTIDNGELLVTFGL